MVDYPVDLLVVGFNPITSQDGTYGPGRGLWSNSARDRILFGIVGTSTQVLRAFVSTAASKGEAWAEVDVANHPTDWTSGYPVCVQRHPTNANRVCVIYHAMPYNQQPDIVVREFDLEMKAWGIEYGGTSFPNRPRYFLLLDVIARPDNADLVALFQYNIQGGGNHIAYAAVAPGPGATWSSEIEACPSQPGGSWPTKVHEATALLPEHGLTDYPMLALADSGKVYALFGIYISSPEKGEVWQSILDTDNSVASVKICDGTWGDFAGWTGVLHAMNGGATIISSGGKIFVFLGTLHYDTDTDSNTFSTYAGYCADGDDLILNLPEIDDLLHETSIGCWQPRPFYVNGSILLSVAEECDNGSHSFYCTYTVGSPPVRSAFALLSDLFPATVPHTAVTALEQFMQLSDGRRILQAPGFWDGNFHEYYFEAGGLARLRNYVQ